MVDKDNRSFEEKIQYLSQGNPGALTVVMDMIKFDFVKSAEACACLEFFEITGPNLWIVYKDVFNEDMADLVDFILSPRQAMPGYDLASRLAGMDGKHGVDYKLPFDDKTKRALAVKDALVKTGGKT